MAKELTQCFNSISIALLSQGGSENKAWERRIGSDRLREKPAAGSLTAPNWCWGELDLYPAWQVILLWDNLATTR